MFVSVALSVPPLPSLVAMAGPATNTEFGLRATENLLRGGKLLQPELITGLRMSADGSAFVALTKDSASLSRFLTGRGLHGRPLSKTLVFETLMKSRNLVVEQQLLAVRAGEVGAVPLADAPPDDQLASLDLGDDGDIERLARPSPTKGRSPGKVVLLAQLPDTLVVEYPGSDWQVEVLTELGYRTVHMKFTVENMDRLLAMVEEDVLSGSIKRRRFS